MCFPVLLRGGFGCRQANDRPRRVKQQFLRYFARTPLSQVVRGAAKRRYRFQCFGRRQANPALQTSGGEYSRRFCDLRQVVEVRRRGVNINDYMDRVPASAGPYTNSSSTSTLQIKIPYFAVRPANPLAFQPYIPRSTLRDFSLTFELQKKISSRCAGYLINVNTPNCKFEIRCSRERGFVSGVLSVFFFRCAALNHQVFQAHQTVKFSSSRRGQKAFFFAARLTCSLNFLSAARRRQQLQVGSTPLQLLQLLGTNECRLEIFTKSKSPPSISAGKRASQGSKNQNFLPGSQ
ncbi:hypothetical protein R3P38DRAFT_3370707 [Favolaschia claudopus]|uniref:Uncharacterized protein n=1 Tax=Favolaschia claudopus TaxID=2862362 RepID=A0AAW0A1D8_9AGAR